jgi:putative hydrolase of the HAD superfamily
VSSLIEVVVLDLGGVVCTFAPERRLGVLAELTGLAPEVVDDAVFGSGLDGRAERGDLTHDEAYAAVGEALGVTIEPDDLRRAWATAFAPDHELLALVRRVRRPTALFSNNGPILEDCLGRELTSVTTAFDRLLLSWRLQGTKPDPEAFAKATAALGIRGPSVLFVDDSVDNVRAAAHAGWIAHRYRGVQKLGDLFEAHELLPHP